MPCIRAHPHNGAGRCRRVSDSVITTGLEVGIPKAQECGDTPANDGGNTEVTTRLPCAGFSITIRIAVTADASTIGRLTSCVGEAGAIVTALDVVDSDPTRVLVDLTCDTADSNHADQVVKTLEELDGVDVRKVSDRTFLLHLGGKIEVSSKVALRNRDELSRAYTPGVARVCMAIAENPADD